MKTILISGRNGQVGYELARSCAPLGKIICPDKSEFDLSKPDTVLRTLQKYKPAIILNAAAYTAVDKAESEKDLARTVNAEAPAIMAAEAKKTGAVLVHYSTDYVFNGSSREPWLEDDATDPLNTYGLTKLEGERAITRSGCLHFTFRTSWVYAMRGKNFLLTMLRLAAEKPEMRIVDDQIGAPTWARMIAEATAAVLASGGEDNIGWLRQRQGIYHLTGAGSTSWCGFAKRILELDVNRAAQKCERVLGIPTSEYPTPAKRPLNSVMSSRKLQENFGIVMPDWDEQLQLAMQQ